MGFTNIKIKVIYFDEDPEWLEGLEPDMLKTRKRPINRIKMSKRKSRRDRDTNTTIIGGVRL